MKDFKSDDGVVRGKVRSTSFLTTVMYLNPTKELFDYIDCNI